MTESEARACAFGGVDGAHGSAAAMSQMSELLEWEREHRTKAQAQASALGARYAQSLTPP